MKLIKPEDVKHPNFIDKGQLFIVRCPECKQENWAPSVSSGTCAWCGEEFVLDSSK